MNIGNELKFQRQQNNLSLLQLEKATGISNQNLSRWERNEVIPNIEFCIKLADFYGITLDELVGREHIPTQNKKAVIYNNSTHNGNNIL